MHKVCISLGTSVSQKTEVGKAKEMAKVLCAIGLDVKGHDNTLKFDEMGMNKLKQNLP